MIDFVFSDGEDAGGNTPKGYPMKTITTLIFITSFAILTAADLPQGVKPTIKRSHFMEYSEAFDGAKAALKIWPDGKMPGEKANGPEHAGDPANDVLRISGVNEPALYLYPAQNATKPAPCMIVCPGGGYSILAWNLEGTEIAEFLAANGMTAVILKYRCPNNRQGAFQDAQRAIRQVRAHAAEWGSDPQKVGYLGYSAGGGVALAATLQADGETRPSFLASCYGPSLTDVVVPENAPNLFIAVRARHNNVAAGMLALFLEWKKAGANAEMYIYDDGQGPFGPGDDTTTSGAWREHFYRWMLSNGWVTE